MVKTRGSCACNKNKKWERENNGIDDRGSVHVSGDQIKVVPETRKTARKITWDLDE